MSEQLYLTGLTGSIGSRIAAWFLARGATIHALVRGEPEVAAAKVDAALAVVGAAAFRDRVHILRGDLGRDRLPDPEGAVDTVLHAAACLGFAASSREENERVNVAGTRRLLALAERHRVPFVHLSTAYVAGTRSDRVTEDDGDCGQRFHNPYEASKARAEQAVRDWAAGSALPATILRPSIVTGAAADGAIVHFDGLYHLLRFFDDLDTAGDFRVLGCPTATKNIVPVDWVAEAVGRVVRSGRPGTYHLTHPRPLSLTRLRDLFAALFAPVAPRFVTESAFARRPATRSERLFQKVTTPYRPYLQAEPVFDRAGLTALGDALPPLPDLDRAYFARCLDYARRARWGNRAPAPTPPGDRCPEVSRYFEGFLAAKQHQRLLPDLRSLTAACRIRVRELPGTAWSLDIRAGRLERISRNGLPVACTFTLNRDTFNAIVAGRLAPQQAFFQRRVTIEGNIETGLHLAAALAAFFRLWPYPEARHV